MSFRAAAMLASTVLLAGCGGDAAPAAAEGSARQRCPGAVPPLPAEAGTERRAQLEQGDAEAAGRVRELGLGPDEALAAKDVVVDPDGRRSVRYDRYARCVEVLRADLVVHVDPDAGLRDVTWSAAEGRLSLPDPGAEGDAGRAAAEATRTSLLRDPVAGRPEPGLLATGGPAVVLVWRVPVSGAGRTEEVLVDAGTGRVRERLPGEQS